MKPLPLNTLQSCASGDARALELLYHTVAPVLLGMSARYYINRDDRVSIVNNAFFKIVQGLQKQIPEGSFEAWCKRVFTNAVIDEFRKDKKRKALIQHAGDHVPEFNLNDTQMNEVDAKYNAEDLEKMLHQLPEASRMVFSLFALEGFTHQEIALQMGISEGTSKWHVANAREKLKHMLLGGLNK
jgi:RNA polymerase sigma-70 factor (ECF subfamily)